MGEKARIKAIVRVSNIPQSATAKDLLDFVESVTGKSSFFAVETCTDRKNWKSRGFGRVQFETLASKSEALGISLHGELIFKGFTLSLSHSHDDVVLRPVHPQNRVENRVLRLGLLAKAEVMRVVESWGGVKAWVMTDRKSLEFWMENNGEIYRLELLRPRIKRRDKEESVI